MLICSIMSLSLSSSTYNRQNWEDSDFPVLCETCLGDNPYVRMIKDKYGKECKVCERPFTTFRWCPGPRMRYKKTEICQSCSRLKNVCQTCLLDLEYGLPVQVRDHALQIKSDIPSNPVNREYFMQAIEKKMENSAKPYGPLALPHGNNDILTKLARTSPYYNRNRPHICSFWVKGECRRGEECPYRHEKPNDPEDPMSDQNIRDRYYGRDDPVADKLLKRYAEIPKLMPPEDRSITTLFVSNLEDGICERNIRDYFYQFGEIASINMTKRASAFVQFTTRDAAERAAAVSFNRAVINGKKATVCWGRSAVQMDEDVSVGGLPPPPSKVNDFFNLSGSKSSRLMYPSQDPRRLGSFGRTSKPY
ncbi:hypothetical protein ACOME3_002645 [Neoechinorhynchus agilis]